MDAFLPPLKQAEDVPAETVRRGGDSGGSRNASPNDGREGGAGEEGG
jgi:hypothetical protein